jgi:hypothetical protein
MEGAASVPQQIHSGKSLIVTSKAVNKLRIEWLYSTLMPSREHPG